MSEATAIETSNPAAPERDVCALAAELPADNICSLMCDPDAMEAKLLATGAPVGRCYDFYCTLPDSSNVSVGVCLVAPSKRVPTTELPVAR